MKRNIAEEITSRILADLEKGVAPWEKPWKNTKRIFFPINASTKKPYRGINVFVLLEETLRKGFSTPAWMTYRQASDLGGNVRKGERGTDVVFYSRLNKTAKRQKDDEVLVEEQVYWLLRNYTVFNLDQIEGLDHLKPMEQAKEPFQSIQEAESILTGTGAKIFHLPMNKAFFDSKEDHIVLPFREDFKSPEAYYGIALHELTHWTGHPSRLNRDLGKRFGDQAYAFEELVAEMGAAFLCGSIGLPYATRHSDYIGDWIRVLKDHQRAVFTAASKAQQAMDFILKKEFKEVAA